MAPVLALLRRTCLLRCGSWLDLVLLEALSKGELLFGVLLRMPSNSTSIESGLPDIATAELGVVNQLLFDDWLSETASRSLSSFD